VIDRVRGRGGDGNGDRNGLTRRETLAAGALAAAGVAGGLLAGPGARRRAAMTGTAPEEVTLIAHRGCAGQYPENTVAALERSAPHVEWVEIDVRRCGSGELVVFHDGTLDRLTGATGRVADTGWDRLRELTVLGSGEPIPRLGEALEAVPADTGVNVELKGRGLAADAVAVAGEVDNDVLYSSFHPAALEAVGAVDTGADRALLVADPDPERAVRRAAALGCVAVHPDAASATAEFVGTADGAGLAVNAWTVTERAGARRLLSAGVDGLIVDRWDVLDASPGGT